MRATTRLPRAALGMAVLGLLTACGAPPPAAGPAEAARDNTAGFPLQGPRFSGSVLKPERGSSFAHGTLILFNRGRTRLRLDAVTPVGVDRGLRHLGVRIAGLDRTIGFDQAGEWPVTSPDLGRVRPPTGLVLEPADAPGADRGYAVLLGYEVVGTGRATVKGVRVEYTDLDSGASRTVVFGETLAVCPDALDDADCPVEEGGR